MKLFTTTAALSIFIFALFSGVATAQGYDSKLNQPSYWGENCYKIEFSGESYTYTVNNEDATKVIVKGGTANEIYENGPFTDLTAPVNPKNGKNYGISHIIICAEQNTEVPVDPVDPVDPVEPEDPQTPEEPTTPANPEQPAQPENPGNGQGVVDDEAAVDYRPGPQVAGESLPKTLPNTGHPVFIHLLISSLVSTGAGLLAWRKK